MQIRQILAGVPRRWIALYLIGVVALFILVLWSFVHTALKIAARSALTEPLPTANRPSMLDRLADFWWVPIALGLLVSLVGFVVALLRRRTRERV